MKLHLTIKNPKLLNAEEKVPAQKELDNHMEEIDQWLRTRYADFGLFNDYLDLEYDTDTQELKIIRPEQKGPWKYKLGE
jgi:hypothetical protein